VAVSIEKGKLISIISKLRDAVSYIDNGKFIYEEEYSGENEDIVNEIQSGIDIIEDVIKELRRIVREGEKQ